MKLGGGTLKLGGGTLKLGGGTLTLGGGNGNEEGRLVADAAGLFEFALEASGGFEVEEVAVSESGEVICASAVEGMEDEGRRELKRSEKEEDLGLKLDEDADWSLEGSFAELEDVESPPVAVEASPSAGDDVTGPMLNPTRAAKRRISLAAVRAAEESATGELDSGGGGGGGGGNVPVSGGGGGGGAAVAVVSARGRGMSVIPPALAVVDAGVFSIRINACSKRWKAFSSMS